MPFDVGGCMTFVDHFLEKGHGGKCPTCGTQVVIRVPEQFQPEVWERATTLSEIRAVVTDNLDLSIRTRRSLEQLGIVTVGDLLDSTEAQIRQELAVGDSVIAELSRLLASKGLSFAGV
jgi:DNA-directed RNA polymerase alpha subunit